MKSCKKAMMILTRLFSLCLLLFCFSCQKEEEERLPSSYFLLHPWLEKQGISQSNDFIEKDLASLRDLHEAVVKESGLSYEDFEGFVIAALLKMQENLRVLDLHEPQDLYSVINIPESFSKEPFPQQIYKRFFIGENKLGLPQFLDLSRFEVESQEDVGKIVSYYESFLEGGGKIFQRKNFSDGFVLSARGKPSKMKLQLMHGFDSGDRLLVLAFFPRGDSVYSLKVDVPLDLAFLAEKAFYAVLNRPV